MVKIEDLIDNSDLTVLNKNLLSNFVFRAKEEEQERIKVRNLIEVIAGVKHLEGVAIATEEIIIYKILGKDDWDIKYDLTKWGQKHRDDLREMKLNK